MEIVPEVLQNSIPEAVQPAEMFQPPAPQKNSVFFGRFGLRAGWGITIFLVVWFIFSRIGGIFGLAATHQLTAVLHAQMQAQAHPNAAKPNLQINFEPLLAILADGISFLAILGLCWFFSRGERRRFGVYGIGSNRWKEFFKGAFWGLVAMSLLVAVLRSRHVLIFDSRALYGSAAVIYGMKWLFAFLLVGFAEEYAFRGYIQFTLMRGVWGLAEKISPAGPRAIAFWLAATIWSAVFFLAHTRNDGETHFGLFAVFLAGMLFSYALWRTGSLWFGIGMHMTWDWAQSYLFGVADSGNVSIGRLYVTHPSGNPLFSGGAAGPEGSVYVLGALLLLFIVIRFTSAGAQPSLERGSLGTTAPHEEGAVIS